MDTEHPSPIMNEQSALLNVEESQCIDILLFIHRNEVFSPFRNSMQTQRGMRCSMRLEFPLE